MQPLPQLAALGRIVERARHRIREFFRVSDLSATSKIESCVGDNAVKPCPECLRRIKSIQRLMRAQESFLHCILGIFVCQNNGARDRVRPSLMLANQSRKPPVVACLGQANELSLLIRNTDGGVGLLGGQTRFSRTRVVSYRSLIAGVGVEASQIDS